MIERQKNQLVTVFGGSGFVGRHVVRGLARKGYRIRVAVRRPELAGHLQPLGSVGQIHAIRANILSEESIEQALAGSDVLINLVGVLFSRGKQTFQNIHVEGARKLAVGAKQAGINRFIHLSSIGAHPGSNSSYARTKAGGEEAILNDYPEAVIFRSSVIFGSEDEFYNRFASLARMSPALPLIGGGRNKMQPVYVGNIADAVVEASMGRARPELIYELGGPDILTMKEIFQQVLSFTQRKTRLIYVPFWLAKLEAAMLQLLPSPPLTVDQVRLLQKDNIVSPLAIEENRTFTGLGITDLKSSADIVPYYLERFRPKGQFSGVSVV